MLPFTLIVPTSYVRSHPSTKLIERAVRSVNRHVGTRDLQKIIVCDGLKRDDYVEYKKRLHALAGHDPDFMRTTIIELETNVHLSGTLVETFKSIETPIVLVFQHDYEVLRSIDVDGVLKCFDDDQVKHIRLNRRNNTVIYWDYILEPYPSSPIPLIKTAAWSDVPHFARTDYYREFVFGKLRREDGSLMRAFPESVLFDSFRKEVKEIGFAEAHRKYGTFIYGSINDPAVTKHLNGKHYPRT